MTAWKMSVAEAEGLLPEKRRNAEGAPSPPVSRDERVPSPLPPEKVREPPPFASEPRATHNGREPHPKKASAALRPNKAQRCKRKKKCLSDIFGHMVDGPVGPDRGAAEDRFHTTACALKKEAEDSPYADLESVPMLHRPKRSADRPPGKARQRVNKLTGEARRPSPSSSRPENRPPPKDPKRGVGSTNENASGSSGNHSATFPASSGLMTRALRAEGDADHGDAQASPRASADAGGGDASPGSPPPPFAARGSPKRRARKPDKRQMHNGSLASPPGPAGSGALQERPVEIKAESVPRPVSAPSPPPGSPVDALRDVKELMFRSLVKEESGGSDLSAFQPDANYKFSTFLMLLKDMHDTREKEGKPLTIPPSPVLIKEEPLVIPAATAEGGGGGGLGGGPTRGVKVEAGHADRATVLHSSAVKHKKRTKPIMSSESYHFQDFPTKSQVENTDKQHRKRRLPAKLRPVIPGLSSDLANLAYGREYVTGHADLAGPASCPPGASDTSANYLDKNCGASTVAPKKRWQMVEDDERKSGVKRRVSLEMNGSFITASADLNLEEEKQGNSDSFFSENNYSTAGKKKKKQKLLFNFEMM